MPPALPNGQDNRVITFSQSVLFDARYVRYGVNGKKPPCTSLLKIGVADKLTRYNRSGSLTSITTMNLRYLHALEPFGPEFAAFIGHVADV